MYKYLYLYFWSLCFLKKIWNLLWTPGQHHHHRGNISEEQACFLWTSNHNTVKYVGSRAKGQIKFFLTSDHLINSPGTMLCALVFFSLPPLVYVLFCFSCSSVRKCISICFVWLRRMMQVSQCSLRLKRDSSTAGMPLTHNEWTWQDLRVKCFRHVPDPKRHFEEGAI